MALLTMRAAGSSPNAPPVSRSARSLAGIRVSAMVEIALFLGVALAIDQIFFDGRRFLSAHQHPFWILVLLLAVQYGTNTGLLAAAASSIALLAGNLPAQSISQDRFAWLFQVGQLPLLWCVAAVALGELRMRQIRERAALASRLSEAARREELLANAYERLRQAKEVLETRIAGQLRTAVGMYEAARAIEKLDPAEVLLGVADLVRSVMNPEKFSLFLLRDGGLHLALEEGWLAGDAFPKHYAASTALCEEIVGRQRLVSVAAPEDALLLAADGVVASPIVVPGSGRVAGMLKIEKLGFLDLNFSNLKMLKVLCQWIGAAYDNALRFQEARAESVVNAGTELFAYSFLARQLSLLTLLAQRIGFDLTMIVVRLENAGELPEEQQAVVPRIFGRVVAGVLRKTDLAFDYQRTGSEFALVLPATPVTGARVAIDKLAAALQSGLSVEAPGARLSFAVHVIHETAVRGRMELQSV